MNGAIELVEPKDLDKKTKAELIELVKKQAEYCNMINESVLKMAGEKNEYKRLLNRAQKRLNLAESYVEQGRSMINSIMDRWYEYDVS